MRTDRTRVMFIDDDKDFLYLINRVAKKIDVVTDVLTAVNGSDAIDQIRHWLAEDRDLPATIFVDINMPVMNGFEFLDAFKALANQHPHLVEVVKVVMLSSSSDERDKQSMVASGVAQDFIVKQPANLMKQAIERLVIES